jgi:type IV pilus assembly protein PilX
MMTTRPLPSRMGRSVHGQRGIALFVALIVMVALSLAGVALIRSIDTTTSVTGNLAFRQAALVQANWAIEEAIAHVYAGDTKLDPGAMIDTTNTDLSKFYVANFDPAQDSAKNGDFPTRTVITSLPSGIPKMLWTKNNSGWPVANPPDATGNTIRYVIQRMCTTDLALPSAATQSKCDLMQPKEALGTTTGDEAISVGKFPLYRVTVRVDGPNNSLAFVQAMIRG